jgi:hypothetical protein
VPSFRDKSFDFPRDLQVRVNLRGWASLKECQRAGIAAILFEMNFSAPLVAIVASSARDGEGRLTSENVVYKIDWDRSRC